MMARVLGLIGLWALLRGGSARPVEGLYWDIRQSESLELLPSVGPWLRRYGLTRLVVEMDAEDSAPELTWSEAGVRAFVTGCRAYGIEVWAMVWPRPSTAWIAAMAPKLRALREWGVRGVSLDVEGRWIGANLAGFPSLDAAGRALAAEAIAVFGRNVTLTTYPSKLADLGSWLAAVPSVSVQAYSQNDEDEPGREEYRWGGRYGPGNMQDLAVQKAGLYTRAINLDLAAYDQAGWPGGQTAHEAMSVAYKAALRHRPPVILWWSAKHVVRPGRANSYAKPWFETRR